MVLSNTGAYRPDPSSSTSSSEDKTDLRLRESRENDAVDEKFGFARVSDQVRIIKVYPNVVCQFPTQGLAALRFCPLREPSPFRPCLGFPAPENAKL